MWARKRKNKKVISLEYSGEKVNYENIILKHLDRISAKIMETDKAEEREEHLRWGVQTLFALMPKSSTDEIDKEYKKAYLDWKNKAEAQEDSEEGMPDNWLWFKRLKILVEKMPTSSRDYDQVEVGLDDGEWDVEE